MHFDGHHVFVIQLSGRKRWRFSERPAISFPPHSGKAIDGRVLWTYPREGLVIGDAGDPLAAPDLEVLRDEVLEPGDCLYLPPGVWHTTQADRHSVAISISPPKIPAAHWVLEALAELAESQAVCRGDLAAGATPLHDGKIGSSVQAGVEACLASMRQLLDTVDPRQVHRAWLGALRANDPEGEPRKFTLSPDSRLEPTRPNALDYLVAPEQDGAADAIHLYSGGAEWTLPAEARRFVDAVAARASFTVVEASEFDPALSAQDTVGLVEQLVSAGLLTLKR